jgi:DNA-binding GntR family transcriptional regulator
MKKPRGPSGYKSLKEIVHEFILAALRDGRLRPGDRIRQKEICDALGVSRTPVREALLQLEPLGLVSFFPRQEILVNDLTEQDVKELFETIGPLETAAARLATPYITSNDIEKFEESVATMKELLAARDLQGLKREMEAFHEIHLARCPNGLMVSTIRLLKRRFYDVPHRMAFVPEWEFRQLEEHSRLAQLFCDKDADGVAEFMQVHWGWEHNKEGALCSYFPRSIEGEGAAQKKTPVKEPREALSG